MSDATRWYWDLTPERRTVVEEPLRQLARNPRGALVREVGDGSDVRTTVIVIRDEEVWGYRVKFVVDEVIDKHSPAIKVVAVRQVPYPSER